MKHFIALSLGLCMLIAPAHSDERSTYVDFVLVVDTSLSMAGAIDEAKRFAAGEVIGRLALPGDWATVIQFYGEPKVVWSGDIASEADKAALVRSLNTLTATGRFTDIGKALDFMDRTVVARGYPERPKYILLITDERQEAPADSPYYAQDYRVQHPLLEYVRRQDMGSFRVITIGYGLAGRIEGEARSLMTTLSEPPDRPSATLPGGAGATAGNPTAGQAPAGGPDGEGGTKPAGGDGGTQGFASWPLAAGAVLLALVAFIIALARRRRRDKPDTEGKPRES